MSRGDWMGRGRGGLFALVSGAWLAMGWAGGVRAATVTVSQHDRSFSVAHVDLAVGDTLHFQNDDEFTHQMYVVSPSFGFDSDEQEPGQGLDIRFTVAGSYTVHCHIHPRMALRVDVH